MWLRWHTYRKFKPNNRHSYKRASFKLRKFMRRLPPNSLIIDAGANVGDVTAYFVDQGMRVIAFEPDPTALAILRERFSGNDMVTIENKAVGAKAGLAPFFQTAAVSKGNIHQTTWSSLDRRDVHGEPVGNVEIVDLVAYINALPQKVSVLKLDIEGTEAEVLEAILDAEAEKEIGLIVAETHERFSPELAMRIGLLSAV
ncbi:hypothetical protein C7I87_15170 [Mesorhizobium sp. SARCC-RB16n]|nr:hypothetical protein C7I87_15170 [Mesorhizobium sp. SARCC-RB16n]